MEFNILYLIQKLHSEALDAVMVSVFNNIVGSKGEIWVVLGMILLVFPKSRKSVSVFYLPILLHTS